MDIKTATIESLKSLAYDQLVQIEQAQKNLQVINQEIASRGPITTSQESPKEEKSETKKGN